MEIIAEVAQGFEGNVTLGKLLARAAVKSGCDAVKFQMVYADELCVPTYPYFDLFYSLEMPEADWREIAEIVEQGGKRLYFDVYGPRGVKMARNLGAHGVKISTTDFYNQSLLEICVDSFEALYLSVGGIPIEDLVGAVRKIPNDFSLTLMHGFQDEPTKIVDNNLARIKTLKSMFPGHRIGFMDHSLGSAEQAFFLPCAALGMGADCIEKHITLDYLLEIEDYVSALTPDRFLRFSRMLRDLSGAIGNESLELSEKEQAYRTRAGKIAVAAKDLPAGTVITLDDIAFKRYSIEPVSNAFSTSAGLEGATLLMPVLQNEPLASELLGDL